MKKSQLETVVEQSMQTMTAFEVMETVKKTVNGIAARRLFKRLSEHQGDFLPPEPPQSRIKLHRCKWLNWQPDSHPCKQGFLWAAGIVEQPKPKDKEPEPAKPRSRARKRSTPPRQRTIVPQEVLAALGVKPPQRNRIPKEMRGQAQVAL